MSDPKPSGRIVVDESVLDNLFGAAPKSEAPAPAELAADAAALEGFWAEEASEPENETAEGDLQAEPAVPSASGPAAPIPAAEVLEVSEPVTPAPESSALMDRLLDFDGPPREPKVAPESVSGKPRVQDRDQPKPAAPGPKAVMQAATAHPPALAPAEAAAAVEETPPPVVANGPAPIDGPAEEPVVLDAGAEDDPVRQHEIANRLLSVGKYKAGAEVYRKVVSLDEGSWSAHYNLAVCLDSLKRHDEALTEFEVARRIDGSRVEASIGAAAVHLRRDNPMKALELFKLVLNLDPQNSQALFGKGVALQMLERYAEAEVCYQGLLADNPNHPDLLENLAVCSLSMGNCAQALEHADVLADDPDRSEAALLIRSGCAIAQADDETAAQCSAQLVEKAEDSHEAWFNLGVACQRTGRLEVGVDAYKQAMVVEPDRAEAQVNLGAILHECENLQEARQFYETALGFEAGHPGVHWNLAIVAEAQGEFDKAEQHFATVVAAQPTWKEARSRLSRLNPARA